MTIFHKLSARTTAHPELFYGVELTVLGDMSQNGVQTLSSVRGEGMALC